MVTIKNYSMPHNCYDCDLHNYHECALTTESIEEDYCWNGDSREKHCPLREIEAIPKDQYENRLKADMVAMLTELQLEIEEYDVIGNHSTGSYDADLYNGAYSDGMARASSIIQQKIDALKADGNEVTWTDQQQ